MTALVSRIEIARRPDEVFSYVTDPSRFAEWQRDVVSARVVGGDRLDVGSRLTQTRRIGRSERTFTQEVTRSDPPRRWAVRGLDGPIRPSMDLTVEPLGDGDRSRVTFALDFDPHGIGRVLVPLVVRRLARRGAPHSYRNLKELLERR